MKPAYVAEQLVDWLQAYSKEAGTRGVVFGLSGGLDSAVVAGLAVRAYGQEAVGIIMPCYSDADDAAHAQICARALGLKTITVSLDKSFDALCQDLPVATGSPPLVVANIKPRLRMLTLNYHAALRQALVLGATNRSELVSGYFTKHADTGVDLLPIAGLVKKQVRQLGLHLGVPRIIIEKAPTAGLWPGQTDEAEMGITYEQLDDYIEKGMAEPHVELIIKRMQASSEHKRHMPPIPELLLQ